MDTPTPQETRASESSIPGIPGVVITFACTACLAEASVSVPWSEHHTIPKGWVSRDAVGSPFLPRRVDHLFACSDGCRDVLNERFPPRRVPRWWSTS